MPLSVMMPQPQQASLRRKSFRDIPRGSKLGMSWSMEGARLKPLGISNKGPEASGISGRAVDALCMNAERIPLPKLGADWRPADTHVMLQNQTTELGNTGSHIACLQSEMHDTGSAAKV